MVHPIIVNKPQFFISPRHEYKTQVQSEHTHTLDIHNINHGTHPAAINNYTTHQISSVSTNPVVIR